MLGKFFYSFSGDIHLEDRWNGQMHALEGARTTFDEIPDSVKNYPLWNHDDSSSSSTGQAVGRNDSDVFLRVWSWKKRKTNVEALNVARFGFICTTTWTSRNICYSIKAKSVLEEMLCALHTVFATMQIRDKSKPSEFLNKESREVWENVPKSKFVSRKKISDSKMSMGPPAQAHSSFLPFFACLNSTMSPFNSLSGSDLGRTIVRNSLQPLPTIFSTCFSST